MDTIDCSSRWNLKSTGTRKDRQNVLWSRWIDSTVFLVENNFFLFFFHVTLFQFCISQPKPDTPAATATVTTVTAPALDVNLQNLSPNIVSSKQQQQQQQVILQNVQSSSSSVASSQHHNNGKSSVTTSTTAATTTAPPTTQSLVVSVPLSSTANVPGVNLNLPPQNNNNNNNNSTSSNNNLMAPSSGTTAYSRNDQLVSLFREF